MEHKKSILKTVGNKAVLITNDFHCMSKKMFLKLFTFTFSHLADAFIQSDLQLGVHKAINLEEANIQRKCP